MDGDLIGINTAIFSRSGSSSGVGFAVPAVMVRRVVDSAVGGAPSVIRPWLGVKGDTVSSEIAGSLGLSRPQGLVVTEIYPDSPAARAGIRQGDVITAVDGAEINDQGGLNYRVGTRAPNDTVQVTVLRDGRSQTLSARVQALPGDTTPGDGAGVATGSLAGLRAVVLNPAFADSLGGDPFLRGALVTGVARGSLPARIGVRPRDVIRRIDGREVTSIADLQRARSGSEVVILRGGRELTGRMPG
jgi:S1-C subfamily serine protease